MEAHESVKLIGTDRIRTDCPVFNAAIVYRLGRCPFKAERGVRLPLAVPSFSTPLKVNMAYNREIETDRKAAQEHNQRMKDMARERLAQNAKWKREHKNAR